MDSALKTWIDAHPFLQPMAVFHDIVNRAAGGVRPLSRAPDLSVCESDYANGVPLLRSEQLPIALREEGGAGLVVLVTTIEVEELPASLADGIRRIRECVQGDTAEAMQSVGWALTGEGTPPKTDAGLVRFLSWISLRRTLAPLLESFEAIREDDRWRRPYCPACGAPPAMAQLVTLEAGRRRLLSCGCCGTRWGHERVGCPACEAGGDSIHSLEIEGEPRLRVDLCGECKSYLKTYLGEGEEALLLSDWTTLHLDLLARERGHHREDVSLYQF